MTDSLLQDSPDVAAGIPREAGVIDSPRPCLIIITPDVGVWGGGGERGKGRRNSPNLLHFNWRVNFFFLYSEKVACTVHRHLNLSTPSASKFM